MPILMLNPFFLRVNFVVMKGIVGSDFTNNLSNDIGMLLFGR